MRPFLKQLRFVGPFLLSIGVLFAILTPARASDWPQWLGPERDGVWRESGLLHKFPPGGPPKVWRMPIGPGYSGPAVALGHVYITDRERAKDASGKPARPTRAGIPGKERVVCLDAGDGHLIWKHEYDCAYKISYPSGPRATPVVDQDRVYTLGAMGDLFCFDAGSGSIRWSKNLLQEYKAPTPVWGFAAHPLIDGELLFTLVGGPGSAVVALNKATGKEVWRALTDEEICYSPPMIYQLDGKRQLVIWLSGSINGLDPATGKVYWSQAYPTSGPPQRPAVSIATVRQVGDMLFFSTYYHGPMALRIHGDKPAATIVWKGNSDNPEKPDGIHILMAPPVLKDGYIYGVCAEGELRCLDANTGKRLWQTYAATGGKKANCASAFIIPQDNRFIICNDQGDLILAELTPRGYHEIDRAHILERTQTAFGREVVWSHPAFARQCIFARNDQEIICLSMKAG